MAISFVPDENKIYKFYGVDNYRFKLDKTVYEAIEDENDGYRSYLDSVVVIDSKDDIFFNRAIAKVKATEVDDGNYFRGYEFIDITDNHMWLKIGTDNYDDYYPCFLFQYYPKSLIFGCYPKKNN